MECINNKKMKQNMIKTNSVEHWVRQTFEMSNHSCEILAILLLTNKEFFFPFQPKDLA